MGDQIRHFAPSPEVLDEFRDSLTSETRSREFHKKYPEFCDKTMEFFGVMAKFAANAATRDDIDKIGASIREHGEQLGSHERRLNDLDYRVKHLDQLATHMKIGVDANTAIAKQLLQLAQIQDEKLDNLGKSASFKIPAAAWPVIGIVALAVIAAAAGEMAGFIRFLSSIKLFGV